MKKIPTIFLRDPENLSRVTDQMNSAAQWVFDGEGRATRKFDGSPVLVRDGSLFKRYDCKKGRTPPPEFESTDEPDPVTGHWPGWVPINDTPADHWFKVAIDNEIVSLAQRGLVLSNGTYEAIGPHFQGNPEKCTFDSLVRHGEELVTDVPRDFESLGLFLNGDIEGIVYHHPDGRMGKIKARDFGVRRHSKF